MTKFYTRQSRAKDNGLSCGASRTQQHFKDNCDINSIIKRHSRTGVLPLNSRQPLYGDFSNITTLHELKNRLYEINADFMKLPSYTRAKFQNNPEVMLEWLNDPNNTNEAVKLGLLPKEMFIVPTIPEKDLNKPEDESNVNSDTPKATA